MQLLRLPKIPPLTVKQGTALGLALAITGTVFIYFTLPATARLAAKVVALTNAAVDSGVRFDLYSEFCSMLALFLGYIAASAIGLSPLLVVALAVLALAAMVREGGRDSNV